MTNDSTYNLPQKFRDRLRFSAGESFGNSQVSFQSEAFAALDPAIIDLLQGRTPKQRRFWLERVKGASKDTDLAASILFMLAFSKRPLLSQVGACDKEQAAELRKACSTFARLNPNLESKFGLKITKHGIENTATGARCDILSSDACSTHGSRPDIVICNEITHSNDQDFFSTMCDNAAKCPNSIVVVATNAGRRDSWQWGWREMARTADHWYFQQVEEPAPWLSRQDLTDAKVRNSPARFDRLFRGVWTDQNESPAIDKDMIDAAIVLDGPEQSPTQGWNYTLGVDLSVHHDRTSLVLIARRSHRRRWTSTTGFISPEQRHMINIGLLDPDPSTGHWEEPESSDTIRVVGHWSWKPGSGKRVSMIDVRDTIIDIHRRFRCRTAWDPWQSEQMRQEIAAAGIPVMEVPFSTSSKAVMATLLIEAFNRSQIELYDDKQLIADLKGLQIKEVSDKSVLTASRGPDGHCDSAMALCIALVGQARGAAKRYRRLQQSDCLMMDLSAPVKREASTWRSGLPPTSVELLSTF